MTSGGCRLKCDFGVSQAIGQITIWLILTVVTPGVALFVLPYCFLKAPDQSYGLDG